MIGPSIIIDSIALPNFPGLPAHAALPGLGAPAALAALAALRGLGWLRALARIARLGALPDGVATCPWPANHQETKCFIRFHERFECFNTFN